MRKLKSHLIDTVELGTGNYPGDAHCKLSMLEDDAALRQFKDTLAGAAFSISALSCHGNPLHPGPNRAQHDQEVSRKTLLLAEQLGVPVVVDFSGCPGDSPHSIRPNWGTCPWPPEYLEGRYAVLDRLTWWRLLLAGPRMRGFWPRRSASNGRSRIIARSSTIPRWMRSTSVLRRGSL
jgi:sugar phosphate isomerase/epimerase